MKKRFIETTGFTRAVTRLLDDQAYADFQKQLMADPDQGAVIPGCGGLRKIRLALPKRSIGKRGGARVVYMHVAPVNWIFLLDIYTKGEREDLSADEKQILKRLARQLWNEALKMKARNKGRKFDE
jgi:hypothetical protein